MATPAARGLPPQPPDKGSFPLDHYGECKEFMNIYMKCIRGNRGKFNEICKIQAKNYLKCRMDKGLMAVEDLSALGFQDIMEKEQNLNNNNNTQTYDKSNNSNNEQSSHRNKPA